jgi:hypothetical protein
MRAVAASCPRLALDLSIRRQLFCGDDQLEVPEGTGAFWRWLASYVRPGRPQRIIERRGLPVYPPVREAEALWFSAGCESTYCLHRIDSPRLELLAIEDFPQFHGEDRKIGQIHFIAAAIGAALGYRTVHMGVERHDLLLTRRANGGRYVERSPAFLDAWSGALGDRELRSECRDMTKEDIFLELERLGLTPTGTCDRNKDGQWCGECFKCYEAFYTAKAVDCATGAWISPAAFDRYNHEYREYIESEFALNFNNAQQYFARLQIMYDLRFDRAQDVADRPPAAPCRPSARKLAEVES